MEQQPKTEEEKNAEREAYLLEVAKRNNVDTVYDLRIPLNAEYTEFAEAIVKYPSFHAYSISLTLEDTHPLKGKLILLQDMFIEGDARIKEPEKNEENMKIFLRACTAIDRIVDLKAASIKKKSTTTL
jgi:hypothetical protein